MSTSSMERLKSLHVSSIVKLPPSKRAAIISALSKEPPARIAKILQRWETFARPEQLPPPQPWQVWMFLAGRGAGKTRSGAEWIRDNVRQGIKRIGLIAPTAADSRDVMVEGSSGIDEQSIRLWLQVCVNRTRTRSTGEMIHSTMHAQR